MWSTILEVYVLEVGIGNPFNYVAILESLILRSSCLPDFQLLMTSITELEQLVKQTVEHIGGLLAQVLELQLWELIEDDEVMQSLKTELELQLQDSRDLFSHLVAYKLDLLDRINQASHTATEPASDDDDSSENETMSSHASKDLRSTLAQVQALLQKLSPFQETSVDDLCAQFKDLSDLEEITLDKPKAKVKPPPDEHCVVCLDPIDKTAVQPTCPHICCESCFIELVRMAVGDHKRLPLKCPACNAAFTEMDSPQVTAMLEKVRCRGQTLKALYDRAVHVTKLKNPFYCPNKKCDAVFETPPKGGSLFQCSACRFSLCIACKSLEHSPLTCVQFQALPENDRQQNDLKLYELAGAKKWRRCPRCQAVVEREMGCNHMTCRCSAQFCYACGSTYRQIGHVWIKDCECKLFELPKETIEWLGR